MKYLTLYVFTGVLYHGLEVFLPKHQGEAVDMDPFIVAWNGLFSMGGSFLGLEG